MLNIWSKWGASNEISLFLYVNTIIFYLPILKAGSVLPSTVNYTLLLVFLFWGLMRKESFKFKPDTYWYAATIWFFVYAFFGLAFSFSFFDFHYSALKKFSIILASWALFLLIIYPKISQDYIKTVIRSGFVCGFFIVITSAIYNHNGINVVPSPISGRGIFDGFGTGNIYVILSLFTSFVLVFGVSPGGILKRLLSLVVLFSFFSVILDNPLRISYYFLVGNFALLFWVFNVRKFWLMLLVVCFFCIYTAFDGLVAWQVEYIVRKTLNESRFEFFYDLFSFYKAYGLGIGFAAVDAWADYFPYTLLDINSGFMLLVELGATGLILYCFLIFYFFQTLILMKRFGEANWMVYFFGIGFIFLLAPNIAPLGQTSVIEYYLILFYLTIYAKYPRLLKERLCTNYGIGQRMDSLRYEHDLRVRLAGELWHK